jgi:flagellar protein FliO/FliZ
MLKKWMAVIAASIFIILIPSGLVEANSGTVYDLFPEEDSRQDREPIHTQVEAPTVSIVPYFIKFIFSFALIIVLLLYVLKYLKKKTASHQMGGPFHSLGSHPLGQNRSIQMVMIGETLYIVGVGENINLIRSIPPGEEQRKLIESLAEGQREIVSDTVLSKWGTQLKKTAQGKFEELLSHQIKEMKFKREKNKDQKEKEESE